MFRICAQRGKAIALVSLTWCNKSWWKPCGVQHLEDKWCDLCYLEFSFPSIVSALIIYVGTAQSGVVFWITASFISENDSVLNGSTICRFFTIGHFRRMSNRELFTCNVNFSLTLLSSCLPSFHLLLGNIILQKKIWSVKRDDLNFCFRFIPHPCSFSTDASALLSHL